MKKMKVSVAAQTMSATTSAMLKYTALFKTTASGQNVSETMATTGEAVEFIDKLFDSVNGSRGNAVRGKLRGPIKPNTQQHNFWTEAKQILKNIQFIDESSKRARKNNKTYKVRVPSLNGWVTTIESFEGLSKLLFEKFDVKYFYPRNMNQDPLENLFGRIRAINYRNVNPDAYTFQNAFKSLLMSNVMGPHSIYANCEDHKGDTVVDFLKLISSTDSSNVDESSLPTFNEDIENEFMTDPITTTTQISSNQSLNPVNERLRVHSSAYTAGYMCRKVTQKFKCRRCSDTYTQTERDVFHKWIEQRKYTLLKHDNLTYPSKKFLMLYRDISSLIHDKLNKYAYKTGVKKHLKIQILKKFDLNWLGCDNHKGIIKEWLLSLIIRTHVHTWCNIINKILKGGVQEKLVQMCAPQQMAFDKYKAHRLRNKNK